MMAINQVCHERQLPLDIVLEAVEIALVSAYKRNFSGNHSITAQIDSKSGEPLIFVEMAVVDEVTDPKNEISVEEAQRLNPRAEVGGLVSVENTPANFGRIAAQTAKQVILQRIREAERDALYSAYADREGEIVNGTVHKIDPHQVTLSLGKVEAFLPRSEQIPTERYNEGQRLRAYVSAVNKTSRGPQIIVSRTHRNMLRRLLEVEVPEIYNGTVEIKSIAREAGFRSKVAVAALQEGVDPVGSCVGMRGTRIQSIVNELSGEKIDVVQWNPDLSFFIANSLSPAKVMNVMLQDKNGKTAVVVVPDKQLSLAIGKEGQNARLAAKLTGWRIDIKSASEAIEEAIRKAQEQEEIHERVADKMEMFNMASAIVAEKEPVDYTEAELKIFSEVIDSVDYAEMAIARERRAQEEAEKAEQVAKARDILAEAEAILSGQLPEPAADEAVEPEPEATEEEIPAAEVETLSPEPEITTEEPALEEEVVLEEAAVEVEAEPVAKVDQETVVEEEEVIEEPIPEPEVEAVETEEVQEEAPAEEEAPEPKEEVRFEDMLAQRGEWNDEFEDFEERERKKKEARQKKRRLVYDEKLGEVVAERRRKRSRRSDDWEDWLEEYEDEI
jgi:N utilization substance protein A